MRGRMVVAGWGGNDIAPDVEARRCVIVDGRWCMSWWSGCIGACVRGSVDLLGFG